MMCKNASRSHKIQTSPKESLVVLDFLVLIIERITQLNGFGAALDFEYLPCSEITSLG